MKTWEAIKALQEGKKVRRIHWTHKHYIKLTEKESIIIDNYGELFELTECTNDWEILED